MKLDACITQNQGSCLYSIELSLNVPHIPCQMWFERINELELELDFVP